MTTQRFSATNKSRENHRRYIVVVCRRSPYINGSGWRERYIHSFLVLCTARCPNRREILEDNLRIFCYLLENTREYSGILGDRSRIARGALGNHSKFGNFRVLTNSEYDLGTVTNSKCGLKDTGYNSTISNKDSR